MLDGINIVCHALDPRKWFESPELLGVDGFPLEVMESTGVILEKPRKAKYKGLTFSVSPSKSGGVRCWVDGSIHKYKNDGLYNYDRFAFTDIRNVVAEMQKCFCIDPSKAYLHGLEIGVNLGYSSNSQVIRVIKSAIVHKDKAYSWPPRSRINGKMCSRGEYEVKIYHKGNESGIEKPILRLEVKVLKMRFLDAYGLETLADLLNTGKVYALVEVLFDALKHTVFIDPYAELNFLNQRERLVLETFRQPERWAGLDREKRRGRREQLERILEKCNAFNVRADLEKRVFEEWERLKNRDSEAEKLPMFSPIFEPKEAGEKPTFSPLECMGENVGFTLCDEQTKMIPPQEVETRVCCSCGSDISHQRKKSRFCAEKYKGVGAKKCRNKDSNQRKTKRLQVMRAKEKDMYVRITYHAANNEGEQFSDVLHSSEIAVSREWLDRVVRVELLKETPETLAGSTAKELLRGLTNSNLGGQCAS